jgi:hypothetical protein
MSQTFRQFVLLAVAVTALAGCQKVKALLPHSSFHQKVGWKAEAYFRDPKVIALCHAIEANDLAEMERLIKAGADINAQGKGKMTPLLWAFPDNKLDRFKLLLEHGANPNVIVEDDFGTRGNIMSGESVTSMAAKTWHSGYFDAVFSHGGDPNIERQTIALGRGDSPLHDVLRSPVSDKGHKIRVLLEKGADINHVNGSWQTPAKLAAAMRRWDIALMLLEAGADPRIHTNPESNERLVHNVITGAINLDYYGTWTTAGKRQYDALLDWLNRHGESVEEAREDLKRWNSWSRSNGEYQQKMAAEVAERKAREAQAKQQPANGERANQ